MTDTIDSSSTVRPSQLQRNPSARNNAHTMLLTPQEAALRGASLAFRKQQQSGDEAVNSGMGMVYGNAGEKRQGRSPGTSPARPVSVHALAEKYGGAGGGMGVALPGMKTVGREKSARLEGPETDDAVSRRINGRSPQSINGSPIRSPPQLQKGLSVDGTSSSPVIRPLISQASGSSISRAAWQDLDPKRQSFLAATLAASRQATPSVSPSHTGQQQQSQQQWQGLEKARAEAAMLKRSMTDLESARKSPRAQVIQPAIGGAPGHENQNSGRDRAESMPRRYGTRRSPRASPGRNTDSSPSRKLANGNTVQTRTVAAVRGLKPQIPAKKPILSSASQTTHNDGRSEPHKVASSMAPSLPARSATISVRISPAVPVRTRTNAIIESEPAATDENREQQSRQSSPSKASTMSVSKLDEALVLLPSPPRSERRSPARKASAATVSEDDVPPKLPQRMSTSSSLAKLPIHRSGGASKYGNPGNSQVALDSLTNAIMAGSLASARHTPVSALHDNTSSPPLPPPPRRQTSRQQSDSRKGSPQRRAGMLQTLRQPPTRSEDDEERKLSRRPFINKKRHMHQEGARRRWREEITDLQRKRYEAVWASNRGLFLGKPTATLVDGVHDATSLHTPELYVVNVVVRDIWSRSRLPADELAEVWELVHRRDGSLASVPPPPPPRRTVSTPQSIEPAKSPRDPRDGVLTRQEFVVGMWLIDQRLRGRKIPHRVSDSVWDSVKALRVRAPRVNF